MRSAIFLQKYLMITSSIISVKVRLFESSAVLDQLFLVIAGLRIKHFRVLAGRAEVEIVGNLVTIYGGKWTSAPSLSRKVLKKINKLMGKVK